MRIATKTVATTLALSVAAAAHAPAASAYSADSPAISSQNGSGSVRSEGNAIILRVDNGSVSTDKESAQVKVDGKAQALPDKITLQGQTVDLKYRKNSDSEIRIEGIKESSSPSSQTMSATGLPGPSGTTTNWDDSFDKCVSEAAVEAGVGGAVAGMLGGPVAALIAAAGAALGTGAASVLGHCNGKPAMKN